jgi:antitoxin component of RelBE/YafQ-DinJ toxin-antitoxin module
MSDTTVLNIKINRTLKQDLQALARDLALPVSTIITSSIRDVVRSRSITISADLRLKPEVEKELLQLSKDAKAGKYLSPTFDARDIDGMKKWMSMTDDSDED